MTDPDKPSEPTSEAPLDENGCPLPTCSECGAYHQVVRPGKTQPTCLCDAYRHECDQHEHYRSECATLRASLAAANARVAALTKELDDERRTLVGTRHELCDQRDRAEIERNEAWKERDDLRAQVAKLMTPGRCCSIHGCRDGEHSRCCDANGKLRARNEVLEAQVAALTAEIDRSADRITELRAAFCSMHADKAERGELMASACMNGCIECEASAQQDEAKAERDRAAKAEAALDPERWDDVTLSAASRALRQTLIDKYKWKPSSDRSDIEHRDAFVAMREAMKAVRAALAPADAGADAKEGA